MVKKGYAISAISPFTGKRKIFPKRFRKKSTALEAASAGNRNDPRGKRRVIMAKGQRNTKK